MSPSRKSVWSRDGHGLAAAPAPATRDRRTPRPSPRGPCPRISANAGTRLHWYGFLSAHLRGDEPGARLRPQVAAGGGAPLEHGHGRARAAEEAGDHRAPRDPHAVLLGEPGDVLDLEQRAVGDLDDAPAERRPASSSSAPTSRSSANRLGTGRPCGPWCDGAWDVEMPMAPASSASRDRAPDLGRARRRWRPARTRRRRPSRRAAPCCGARTRRR